MAALPRTRRIEEILKQAQLDPRLIAIICEIAERQRVQHQQIYEFARLFVAMQDVLNKVLEQLGTRDKNLEKLGVREMLTNFQNQKSGSMVESVEEFDAGESAHNASREKN